MRIAGRPEDGPRGVVEGRHGHPVAAIHHVEDELAAAPRAVDGKEDRDVRDEGDAARGVARREDDVGDGAVRGVRWIDREVETTGQLLVGAGLAEGAPAREGPAHRHLKARDRHVSSAETRTRPWSTRWPVPWSPIVGQPAPRVKTL